MIPAECPAVLSPSRRSKGYKGGGAAFRSLWPPWRRGLGCQRPLGLAGLGPGWWSCQSPGRTEEVCPPEGTGETQEAGESAAQDSGEEDRRRPGRRLSSGGSAGNAFTCRVLRGALQTSWFHFVWL